MKGMEIGLSVSTYLVWKRVVRSLGLDWERLTTQGGDPGSIWAWREEVVVERFHPSILRRLAERALEAGAPQGEGAAWRAAGGTTAQWLELDDLLRTLRGHRDIDDCALLAGVEEPGDPAAGDPS